MALREVEIEFDDHMQRFELASKVMAPDATIPELRTHTPLKISRVRFRRPIWT